MTSAEIRQSFLDFFREKQHTIVPSASLLPDSPNLLFTNAGMNQFVPIFLGQRSAPYDPPRAADTQKCIRAGGKHNDLDDVGLDTYHHTFFEMLGNWSFGDYFKKEAIEWAWELVVEKWKLPPSRLYATVYKPGPDEPSEFDQEAHDHWARLFEKAGLDPAFQIVNGNKKDNFWMMGETGPCGPCSELHIDLTPAGDTKGSLVNAGDPRCIEIWNLVFIQFNANADGTFASLPQRHVDTGMGFERVTAMIQGTKHFADFSRPISNYETDIFRPIFDEIERLSGKSYGKTLPEGPNGSGQTATVEAGASSVDPETGHDAGEGRFRDRENAVHGVDATFREPKSPGDAVIGSSGMPQSPTDAVIEDFGEPKSPTDTVIGSFGEPKTPADAVTGSSREPKTRADAVSGSFETPKSTPPAVTAAFQDGQVAIDIAFRVIADHLRTLSFAIADGIQPGNTDRNYVLRRILRRAVRYGRTLGFHEPFFYKLVAVLARTMGEVFPEIRAKQKHIEETLRREEEAFNKTLDAGIDLFNFYLSALDIENPVVTARIAFTLYDTHGFPLDLTELMARERGLSVDVTGFERHMEAQRARARAAQKKQTITIEDAFEYPTEFVGFECLEANGKILIVVMRNYEDWAVVDTSPFYAEMGGQVGDTGQVVFENGTAVDVLNTIKRGNTFYLKLFQDSGRAWTSVEGTPVKLIVDAQRRRAIERHHTVTHLLHWALHEVVSREASQKGSFVGPDKLTFDFNSPSLTPAQVREVERLVNEKIVENASVSWLEVPHAEVKARSDIMQFFGDKYGDSVRVVQIGGEPRALDGYSMELCGGTHTRATGEIGLFRIVSEGAVAAGVRRIEAVAGLNAYDFATAESERLKALAAKLNAPVAEMEKKVEAMLAQQKELEKQLKSSQLKQAGETARELLEASEQVGSTAVIIRNVGAATGDQLQVIADGLKQRGFKGIVILAAASDESVALVASVSPEFTAIFQAGKIIQAIAPIVGGKGGGRAENARGAGKDASKIDDALERARQILAA